jgi:hypothetical protein
MRTTFSDNNKAKGRDQSRSKQEKEIKEARNIMKFDRGALK